MSSKKDVPGCSYDFEIIEDDEQTMIEPSPLDRYIADGRCYNAGNWTSDELKSLSDTLIKYGTKSESIQYMQKNLLTRSKQEVQAKIDEIREIFKEHKEIGLPEAYRKKWIEKGYRNNVLPMSVEADPNEDWNGIIQKVLNHHHKSITSQFTPMRDTFEKVFEKFALESKVMKDVKVTEMKTARAAPSSVESIRWPVIYQFLKASSLLEEEMPPINELEASVLLKVIDSIEKEAQSMPENEKSILVGMFNEVQMNDFRHSEQDYPPSLLNSTQLFVDPLRTRFHGVPEVGEDVTLESIQDLHATNN